MTRIELIQRLPAGTIGAEIGTYRGDFAAEILKTQVNRLYIVDCWEHQGGDYRFDSANVDQGGQEMNERIVRERFKKDHRAVIVKGYSNSVADLWQSRLELFPPLDWVYIDGNHTLEAVTIDLYRWSKNLKSDGMIFCHDYHITPETEAAKSRVKQAVDAFCGLTEWRVSMVTDEGYPTCVLQRRGR